MERSPLIPSKMEKRWKKDLGKTYLFFPYIYILIYIYKILIYPFFLFSKKFLKFSDFRDFTLNSKIIPWKEWKKGIKGQVCDYKWVESRIFFPYPNGKKEKRVS